MHFIVHIISKIELIIKLTLLLIANKNIYSCTLHVFVLLSIQNGTLLIVDGCLKSFSSIALPILPGSMTKDFQIFLSTIVNNSLNFYAKWGLYSIIDGTNFAELLFLNGLMSVAMKEEILEPCILGTVGSIPVIFDT